MDIYENWREIKKLFTSAFKSSFHFAIASVTENGEPHLTPIGSLILGKPGQGIYFEAFTRQLPRNLSSNQQVCVLAVNSSRWFWLRSLLAGRFLAPPAVRLYGIVGERRQASDEEIALWQKRVRKVRFSKGHALMWRGMHKVRDIQFTGVEPIHIGAMTRANWLAEPGHGQ